MKYISTDKAPAAIGPYSQGIIAGDMVFLSGQIGVNPADGNAPDGIEAQAEQACKNVGELLKEAGTDFSRLENGTLNPSLALLKRVAEALDTTLRIEFVPNESI